MNQTAIECRNVWKIFGRQTRQAMSEIKKGDLSNAEVLDRYGCVIAVAGATFSVARGEVFCIMGLSGCGKSTLIRHINQLIKPTSGKVLINGEDINQKDQRELRSIRAENIGMVFQNVALFPHRTVSDNVTFGLELRNLDPEQRRALAEEHLKLVRLGGWEDCYPAELSGGMQQRVGLARALATNPDILLMDEPFSALDPLIRRQLQDQLIELLSLVKKTTLLITHDLEEAMRLGDRIAIMKDGALVQIGTPEQILARPANEYVANFTASVPRLKLLQAHAVMQPLDEYRALGGGDLANCPTAPKSADLDTLLGLAIGTDRSIAVVDGDGEKIGVITKQALLRDIKERSKPAPALVQIYTESPVVERSECDRVELYAGPNAAYYFSRFQRMSTGWSNAFSMNWAAAVLGPLWAAARGLWTPFWFGVVGEILGLIFISRGLMGRSAGGGEALAGLALLLFVRALEGLTANWAYYHRYARWRIDQSLPTGISITAILAGTALLAAVYPLMIYRFSAGEVAYFIADFPTTRKISQLTARGIDTGVDWLTINFDTIFTSITAGVLTILNFLEFVFVGIPWPVMSVVILLITWHTAGRRTVLFTAAALAYLGIFGFWQKSMSTVSLVGASVFICFVLGMPLGIWCAKNSRANSIIKPILDFMQTMPSFVYLIPAIAFFSIGKPPGVLATVIFAMPPMIRLTTLGIRQVPTHVKEAAIACGASQLQLLVKIELPLAIPSIMTGINQTIMMSLSMVVVAALIGAGGLGYDVLFALQHIETGRGILAGIAIVFCAMILDRIVQGYRQ